MSTKSRVGKRRYRHRVKCDECQKEMNSDYQETHTQNVHNGKKIKFSRLVESLQSKLGSFFTSAGTTVNQSAPEASDINSDVIECTPNDNSIRLTESQPNVTNESDSESRDGGQFEAFQAHNVNIQPVIIPNVSTVKQVKEPVIVMDENIDESIKQVKEPVIVMDEKPDESMVVHQKTLSVPLPVIGINSPTLLSSNNPPPVFDASPTVTSNGPNGPNQPILSQYPAKTFGNEPFPRKFNPQLYKKYPWISYEMDKDQCVCFPCREFEKDDSFVYNNWRKPEKLSKHGKSENHITSMTKWALFTANQKLNTSVLKKLNSAHKQQVISNRQYLQVIIECLVFASQQNIAMRGHVESRKDIWEVSDINRGNFLELLHLRCKDLPWLKQKLQSQLKSHAQWTSPKIQNEIIAIVSNMVLKRITSDVRNSAQYSIIADETADISRTEQVSLCLRYVFAGETKETFVGFYTTASTEGEVLYELMKESVKKLDLKLEDIVGKCFDGAANMSGVNKGLASRMKECSPLSVYVHCYGHLLNLALQDTMTNVEPIRNALGTVQSLYNFLEASPKRHRMFQDIEIDEDHINLTLKSLSVTRWSCRWEAVKAVDEQMPRIIQALLALSKDRNPKTYTDSMALLNAICDFKFVFGLLVLKVILSNTASLSKYLQGKNMDVITAKNTADATIETLSKCRNEESFQLVWSRAEILSQAIKKGIEGSQFSFKDARAPRGKPSRRLQALVGEQSSNDLQPSEPTAESHYRITTYYQSLDKVLLEMKSRFEGNDQDILCALADVVFNEAPSDKNLALVSSFYTLDVAILTAEKAIFQNFLTKNTAEMKRGLRGATMIVENMFQNGLHEVLPVFYRVCSILATIPATSCSAERSFSSLRRVKTYLRSTMGQERLSSLAVICIERAYTNRTLENDMESIIDIFGKHNRVSYFF